MNYNSQIAKFYSHIGIKNTTYEPAFIKATEIIKTLKDLTVLDVGCGTGRSSRLLNYFNPLKVIGVDTNPWMIEEAIKLNEGIEYLTIDKKIPLKDSSIDFALSAHVLVETKSLNEMIDLLSDIFRVLKPQSKLVIITTNPDAIGKEFISYNYPQVDNLKSGNQIKCIINTETPFEIFDHYWLESDYKYALTEAGFKIDNIYYPKAKGTVWKDENNYAPDIVIEVTKP